MTIRNALNNYLQNNPQVRQNILKGFDAATKQSGASSPANKANQDNSIFSQKYSPEIQELLNQTDKQLASADQVLAEAREKLGPQKHSMMDIVRGFLQKNPELVQNLNNLSNQFNTVKPEDSPKTSEPAPANENAKIDPEIQAQLDQQEHMSTEELLNFSEKLHAKAQATIDEAKQILGPQKHSTMDIVKGFLEKNPELVQNLNNLSNQFNTVKPEDSPKTSEPAPATQNPNIRPEIQELLDQTDKQLASADQVLAEAREKLGTNDQQAQQVTKQED